MKTPIIGLLVLFPHVALSAVPNKFTPNTPAKAAEVNANFEHLDTKTEENKTAISANTSKSNTNTSAISENTNKITTNSTSISSNTQRIQNNETTITNNVELISANSTSVSANAASITSNTQRIQSNETALASSLETISANSTAISANSSGISANETTINTLSTRFNNVPTKEAIDSALAEIDSRLAAIEGAGGSELEKGKLSVDVDCTNDPAALQTAFADTINVSNVDFFITGNCYGDINVVRGTEGQEFLFIAGRAISISAKDPEARAGLIPNDETGRVGVNSGLSGGLYLTNLDIQAGEGDFNPVAYYRNGHGSVNNVTISGSNWTGILVQEGAQVYFSGITVTESSTGIFARSNAVLRFFNDNTINVNNFGIELFTASSLNQQGNINVTVNEGHAIKLESSSTWQMHGNRTLSSGGSVYINSGSSIVVNDMTLPSGNLDIHQGVMRSNSNLMIENGDLSVSLGGSLAFNSLTTNHMHLSHGASLSGNELVTNNNTIVESESTLNAGSYTANQNLDVSQSGNVNVSNMSVIGDLNINSQSRLRVHEVLQAEKGLVGVDGVHVDVSRLNTPEYVYIDKSTIVVHEYGNVKGLHLVAASGRVSNLSTSEWSGVQLGSSLTLHRTDIQENVDVGLFQLSVTSGSALDASNMPFTDVFVHDSASISLTDSSVEKLLVHFSSTARLKQSDVLNEFSVFEGASLTLENSTISVDTINILNSKAFVYGESNGTLPSQFSCTGSSVLHIDGWRKLDHENRTVDNSTNCVDEDTWNNVLNNFLGSFSQ